jgi:hypothetical protein
VFTSQWADAEPMIALRDEALLANPLLDFDRLLLVKRGNNAPDLGSTTSRLCCQVADEGVAPVPAPICDSRFQI